jgi:replicative DNA helicase
MAQTDPSIERVPPQSLEAEMAVLGAMLMEKEAVGAAIEALGTKEAFYESAHRKIYETLISLYERNQAVDLLTASEELLRRNQLEEVGGRAYLATLMDSVPTAAHIGEYARVVMQKYILRRLISTATQILAQSYEGREKVEDLLDRSEQAIFGIKEARLRQGFLPVKSILVQTFAHLERLHENKRDVTGLETGFKEFDKLTAGLQPGEFIVIAGRPATGKTSFALNIALRAAVKNKIPVAIFSLEMNCNQLVQRLLCTQGQVSGRDMRTGYLSPRNWVSLTHSAGELAQAPLFIDDSATLTHLEIRAKARRLKAEVADLGLVIVDYMQLVQGPQGAENRQQEISSVSRSFKALAKELNIPVIALSQLSRDVEKRGKGSRPVLSDLRESGAIEQDADVVLFLHPQKEEDLTEPNWDVTAIVAKQRNGPTGDFRLVFNGDLSRFGDLAPPSQWEAGTEEGETPA